MIKDSNPLHKIEDAFISNLLNQSKVSNLVDWVSANRTLKGKPWKWQSVERNIYGKEIVRDYRYIIPIYLDTAEEIIVKKSRQMAFSEFGINWILGTVLEKPYLTALHVFPNKDQAKKFSMVRLTPLFNKNDSPKIAKMLVNPEEFYKNPSALQAAANVFHKQFTNQSNYILSFVGGENTKSTDARSVTADMIFLDEAKDLPEDKLADVLECMSASSIKQMRMVGTPDFEGTVFDNWYNESNRNEWVVTCKECGCDQILTFDNISSTKGSPWDEITARKSIYYYACINCKAELDRTADHAKWVSQNPSAATHGYHVSQLMASWITADEIMAKKSKYSKQPWKFPNEVLGLTYEGTSKPITYSKLLRCQCPTELVTNKEFRYVTFGNDWGNQSHYVILGANGRGKRYILDYGILEHVQTMEHANSLDKLADVWAPGVGVMDSGYGKTTTQQMFKQRPGKFYACFYKESSFKPEWETITVGPDGYPLLPTDFQYHVTVDHTMLCDSVLSLVDYGNLQIPIDPSDDLVPGVSAMRDMLDNLCLARVIISDSSRSVNNKRRWVITKAHFFAALAYANLAMDHLVGDEMDEGAEDFHEPHKFSGTGRRNKRRR